MLTTETHRKIRVLVADDSFFIRTFLSDFLRTHGSIEVVGVASSGGEVVELAHKLAPDVITMDYNMPGKNGIEATAEIMLGGRPLPAIIMLSAFSGEEGERVRAMLVATGAHVIEKPSGEISVDIEKVGRALLEKIQEIGLIEVRLRTNLACFPNVEEIKGERMSDGSALRGVVVIGASTGGPPLVEHLLLALDSSAGISVIIVQHMSPYFTLLFAERLERVTSFRVREARDGDTVLPGEVLVVPGGSSLLPSKPSATQICAFSVGVVPHNSPEVEIDNTMMSIATCYPGPIVGVVLSGMGRDGSIGLRAIHHSGGLSLAQDPKTAAVGSMPQHALDEGEAQAVSIEDIPRRIMRYFAQRPVRVS
jgi:two-component system chemotaxis response regulator CheB